MIFNGGSWFKLLDMSAASFTESRGFSAGRDLSSCKLPVLSQDPAPQGLSAGAFYISATTKSIRFFDGKAWRALTCQAVVKTLPVQDITGTGAKGGGEVLVNGGSPVTLTGLCWSPNINPDINQSSRTQIVATGTGLGMFESWMNDLMPNTTYHVRAYAINDQGVVYGDDIVFKTPIAPPTIVTLPATKITSLSAESGGSITADGGSSVTARGIIWSANRDPLADSVSARTDDGSGVGPFPSSLDGLLGNTTYYVRAFAVNAAGTAYGNLIQFTTTAPVPPLLNPTLTVFNITGNSAEGSVLILNNGGALVSERGICYTKDQVNWTYVSAPFGSSKDIGSFLTTLTGLDPGTTYYAKAYAKNSAGTGYSSEASFTTAAPVSITTTKPYNYSLGTALSGGTITNAGFSKITKRGICWGTEKFPTVTLPTTTAEPLTADGIGGFGSTMKDLLPGTTYYVRAYAVNSAGVSYGNMDSLVVPRYATVQTLAASSLYPPTATVGGRVLDDGGAPVTERGICWSTAANPTTAAYKSAQGSGLGWFNAVLTGLQPNVVYHFRAYAINSTGVAYGEDMTFTIIPEAPVIKTLNISEITSMSALSGGDITSGGGAPITLRGIIWSTSGDPAGDPNATIVSNDGSGVGYFPSKMEHLLGNTTYYVRAYAVNRYGKAYGDLKIFTTIAPVLPSVLPPSFDPSTVTNTTATGVFLVANNGGAVITDRGIRYSKDRKNYIYVSSATTNSTDIGTFVAALNALVPNSTYYAQAYATNRVGTAISAETSFRTSSLAVLTTIPPSSVTGFSAFSGGDITHTGDDVISAKGVCWSTGKNPTISLDTKTSEPVSGLGTGLFNSSLTNLSPGTKYYIRAYAVNSFGVAYGNLDSLNTASTARLTTIPVHSITSMTAVSGGYIPDDGNSTVWSRGICWSTSPNPTTADSYWSSGSGVGTFSVKMSGLMGATTYYVRAYATNDVGTGYGNQESFTTAAPEPPLVLTRDVINIGGKSALGRGVVSNNGGALVTERGICWSTSENPTIQNARSSSGEGTGGYSAQLSGLNPNTRYYARAYAINSAGVAYGENVSFLTFTIPTILTTPAYAITSTDAKSGGDIVSDGGSAVTSSGICWNTTGNPTTNDTHTTSGIGVGNFIHNISRLMGSTRYFVRAYAINSAGIAYGNSEEFVTGPPIAPVLTTMEGRSGITGTTALSGGTILSDGGAPIHTEGLVWSAVSGFKPDTAVVNRTIQAGGANFTSTIKGLKPGTTYYARAYATNAAGTSYANNEVIFKTFDVPAIVTITPDPASITSVGVKTGGTIVSNGGTDIIQSGLCWSTNPLPIVADEHTTNGYGSGSFATTITDLLGGTTYYVRAYATNTVGTGYGAVETFTTKAPVLATVVTAKPVASSSVAAQGGGNILSHGGSPVTTRGICWSTERNFNPDTVTLNKTAQTGYFKGSFNADLTGLTPNTIYYVKAYVVNSVGTAYGEEMSFRTPTLASLTTAYATANGPTKASSGGHITDDGGAEVTDRGVVWSTVASFVPDTVSVNRMSNGGGSGSFVSKLTGLKGSTTYYIRAFAKNIAGTAYGNLLSFITDPPTLPTVTTRDAWNINGLTAVTGGIITDDGGEAVTTRGVVWSTRSGFNPDTVSSGKTVHVGSGNGSFSTTMTGLNRGTTYYVRAYAINSVGIAYGDEITFITLDLPKLNTLATSAGSDGKSATSGGQLIHDGGAAVTNQGVCWSTSPSPTVNLHSRTTNDQWSGTSFNSSLTGLDPVTKYYVRAYASNSQGTGYGEELVFTTLPSLATISTTYAIVTSKSTVVTGGLISAEGGAPVTERGVVWSTDENFNPDTVTLAKTNDGAGAGSFSSTVVNMELSQTYYIRAYAKNAAGIAYGNQIAATIFPTAPILKTNELTEIGGYAAKSGGVITSDGGAPVTLKGICWNTQPNPTVSNSRTYNGEGTEAFGAMLSNLKPNTLYYVRAYAINKIGTAYGIERTFQTNGIPTLTATDPVSNIVATSAQSGGEITDDGRTAILVRGLCWSRYSNPDVSLSTKTEDKSSGSIGSFTATMRGLAANTTYYVRAYATNGVGTGYGSQVQFTTLPVMLPSLVTLAPTAIDSVKATSGGDISDDGGMPITGRGICWSTNRDFTIAVNSKVYNSVSAVGEYTNDLSGLLPGTKYYVKAFAINSKGTAYGNLDSLITAVIRPSVSNVQMSELTMVSAKGTASLISTGGDKVTGRGLCWNTSGKVPSYPFHPDSMLAVPESGLVIAGTITKLLPETKYYVWAYATNSAGTRLSQVATVITTPTLPTLTTNKPSAITKNSATAGGTISKDGGLPVTARGIVYSRRGIPTLDSLKITHASGGAGSFSIGLSGLVQGATYYIRAYATNAMGTAYGNLDSLTTLTTPMVTTTKAGSITSAAVISGGEVLKDGGVAVTSRGVCWSGTEMPTVALLTKTSDGSGLGAFQSKITGLKHITTYYIRAYATNSLGTSYGAVDTIRTEPIVPTVGLVTISSLSDSAAVGSVEVTDDGGAAVTARGFVWSTKGSPSMTDNMVQDINAGLGSFEGIIRNLKEGPTYYIRAFATNSVGTAFSKEVTSFKICKPFTAIHTAGLNGAPVSKTVQYGNVSSNITGNLLCWLTQNLGADRQATAVNDASEAAAGWYWQFNRPQGYKSEAGVRTPSNAWTTWIGSISENQQWLPANDPCNLLLGLGWRIPSSAEWTAADAPPQNWTSAVHAYSSALKLHSAGMLTYNTGGLEGRGVFGWYWSSTQYSSTSYGNFLNLNSGSSVSYADKAYAMPLRCVRDTIVRSKPTVSNVIIGDMTSSTAEGSAIVSLDGGALVVSRGLCFNTTGLPTIDDTRLPAGNGVGSFTGILQDLEEGPTYYVRAYATNSQGTSYSPLVTSFKICPTEFDVIHTGGLNGAPVTKTVKYHSVSSNISGAARCWLTQNLGADQQATAINDASEASAGWYWQFNRPQGYKSDGGVRTPSNAWTSWISSISENQQWLPANDPCNLLLGLGWRIPTSAEWTVADAPPQNWTSPANAYASVLKLHSAGMLTYSTGGLEGRGAYGRYWSSTQYSSTAYGNFLELYNGSAVGYIDKAYALPVRCIRDEVVLSKPTVSDVSIPTTTMTASSAEGTATVASDGGAPVSVRGLCFNTTGTPTTADICVQGGSGTGIFNGTLPGLIEGPTYYVRAYATNSQGTSYSPTVTSFKICPTEFEVIHTGGLNGAPVTKTVTYHSISSNISGAARCWLTQNLGADQQASAINDARETSAGWYWQFNRLQGYKSDGGVRTPSNAWTSWIGSISENQSWQPANDPCNLLLGLGWRIPTSTEWTAADAPPQNWTSPADAQASVLKLHSAGMLTYNTGGLEGRGAYGRYWSSTQYSSTSYGNFMELYNGSAVSYIDKAYALPVRCIRDNVVLSKPTVSNVSIPTTTMTPSSAEGTATVASDGGAKVTERGLCWNTTGEAPLITDNIVKNAKDGLGVFAGVLQGLGEGPTYYVRAYAINSEGTSYSPTVTSFKICPTEFDVIHTGGLNGAPVTKTVKYHSISSNISGAARCWLTQNLGADQEATVVSDGSEASAGWYWQFNRSQGYKSDNGLRTPSNAWTSWISSISENLNWQAGNDPCNLLLGLGWRIPTSAEWLAADAPPQNWTSAANAYTSVLKLHSAGMLNYSTGGLEGRGAYGRYWSSTQYSSTSYGNFLELYNGSAVGYIDKAYALPVRCIRDNVVLSKPTVSDVSIPTTTMTPSSAEGTATVASDGGAKVTERGLCWNTTGETPLISHNLVKDAKDGLGIFAGVLHGLREGPTYYVRAYATNSEGTSYSPTVTSFKICPTEFDVIHTAGLNGAPVTKTVKYHSISSNISGAARCWLTQNLGADQQATAVSDASEASAGWYWQFNRSQGYKSDNGLRTPSNAWTSWISSISENLNWQAGNDPCNLLLGLGWRLPTSAEWVAADAPPQNWTSAANAYASVLKLHSAGMLIYNTGGLEGRGAYGRYWSSTQYSSTSYGNFLELYNGSAVSYIDKSYALPVRCIRDNVVLSKPTVSDVSIPTATMTASSAKGTSTVASDGGAKVTDRGLCWNTSGTPTLDDQVTRSGDDIGMFVTTLQSLIQGPTYYVRAYATNSEGTSYSPSVTSFKICPTVFDVIHTAGLNGAPVTKTVTYHSISSNISGAAACWLTQNLGADQEAGAVNDGSEASAGWYWQFNRAQGYKSDGGVRTPSNAWTNWTSSISENQNWQAANDPCNLLLGMGWRLPTSGEWIAADAPPQNWTSPGNAYASVLKLHSAGMLNYSVGSLDGRGSYGRYWSSTQYSSTSYGNFLELYNGSAVSYIDKAYALPVRCIRDGVVLAKPLVSDVSIPTSTMTQSTAIGTATVALSGGVPVSVRGLCFNTSGTPTTADICVQSGSGTGVFSATLPGLAEGTTYYVRAYAVNDEGTTYSKSVTSFKICPVDFDVVHVAGVNGAPVSKTVTYHSISSNISGAARCWLTQNLGAEQQAASVNDASAAAAGWYWQFNRSRGYQHTDSRSPATSWVTSISENSHWAASNDPCALLLGQAWRIPTATEWTAADAPPQNWTSATDAFNSVLKLHSAGVLAYNTGVVAGRGAYGRYWTSSQYSSTSYGIFLDLNSGSAVSYIDKAYALPLRCIRD